MARLEPKPTKALLKHLGRAEISHSLECKWASAREVPGKESIFHHLSEQGEPAEEDVGSRCSAPELQRAKEEMVLRLEPIVESISSCELSSSKHMEALDLQGSSRMDSGPPKTDAIKGGQEVEARQKEAPENTPLETTGLNMGCSDATLDWNQVQEEGCKQDFMDSQAMARGRDTKAHGRPPEPIRDSMSNLPRKSHSSSKIDSQGSVAGGAGKWKQKGKSGTQADFKCVASRRNKYMCDNQVLKDLQARKRKSVPNLPEGEPTHEAKSKGLRGVPKASPQMNHPEEKKPEEAPLLGPFFYIGGANGVDILNVYCKSKGWQRTYDNGREDYILKWCETKFRDTYYHFREGEQLLYQIPNNKILTTKIGLLMNLREYERVMRKISRTTKMLKMEEFFPETFRLDTKDEREIFFEVYREPHIWICKPTSSNQGRGIFLLKNHTEVKELEAKLHSMEEELQYKKLPYKIPPARIVQRYIDRPLLLEGKKFDVRSYLLIACTAPYMLFFGHGYVRLTCLNYDPRSEDLTSHLTNQYVQKKSPMYPHVKEETVWQMDRFNNYINERFSHIKGLPKDWVFNGFTKRMKEIMMQCFLAVKSKLECKLGYFDLIGCDFLIDEDFKVWLLEMNANPALHTNCGALKNIIPMVVNETLDLAIEIFTKSQKAQSLQPLESLCHFVLLYNGVVSDHGLLQLTKSRTSLRSLRSHHSQSDNSSLGSSSSITSQLMEKQPVKAPEKQPKGEPKAEPSAPPEGISLPPSKGAPRDTLPMPQIQISIVPSLTCCPSVKAILRGNQVCNSGSQYIVKHVPAALDKHLKCENSSDKGKANPISGGTSKDSSYATWFQQTFGTKLQLAGGNGGPLTSSQMVSLHLQSNLPPNLSIFQDISKPLCQLTMHPNPPADNGKVAPAGGGRNCNDPIPEDKISHRGS